MKRYRWQSDARTSEPPLQFLVAQNLPNMNISFYAAEKKFLDSDMEIDG